MNLALIKVSDKHTIKEFIEFPVRLNASNPAYIRPLDHEVEKVFSQEKNKFFRHGECERFICIDTSTQNTVGRFAVFHHSKYLQDQPTGGIGFVDFIDNSSVSQFIFDSAKKWLEERGKEAMDGPINFGERDAWWGLLVEGFHAPLYNMNYNLPYYQKHFEEYGFQVYFHQLCFGREANENINEKFRISHERISENPDIHIECITPKNLEKYANDFVEIYNKAWASHGQGKQLEKRQGLTIFKSMKQVLDPNISFIAYEKEKPIAMWVNLPDLNQWFKYLNGKFSLFHKLKFLYHKFTSYNPKMVGLVFGIIPEWQKKGVDGYIILEGQKRILSKTKYKEFEMQWIGDFNPKMINIAESLDTHVTRKLTTYRYLFDRQKPFQRHPML